MNLLAKTIPPEEGKAGFISNIFILRTTHG
jgi:hypothetical protein